MLSSHSSIPAILFSFAGNPRGWMAFGVSSTIFSKVSSGNILAYEQNGMTILPEKVITFVLQKRPDRHGSRVPPDGAAYENDIITVKVLHFPGKCRTDIAVTLFFCLVRTFPESVRIRVARSMRNNVPPVCRAMASATHWVLPLRLK